MRATDVNRLQEAKKTGVPLLGMTLNTIDPEFVESLGYAGIEYLYIDMEHNTESWKEYANVMRACENSGIFPTLRVKKQYPGYPSDIRMAFEIGAGMVDVPHVNTKEEAIAVVRAAKFGPGFPSGPPPADQIRGVGSNTRAGKFRTIDPPEAYCTLENKKRMVGIMLEEPRAFENAEEIMAVEGIDDIDLGSGDLSAAMGYPGIRWKAPGAKEILQKYLMLKKKFPGKLTERRELDWKEVMTDFEKAKEKIRQGIREGAHVFMLTSEQDMLRDIVRQCKKALNEAIKEEKGQR